MESLLFQQLLFLLYTVRVGEGVREGVWVDDCWWKGRKVCHLTWGVIIVIFFSSCQRESE